VEFVIIQHKQQITTYYESVVKCVCNATADVIPQFSRAVSQYNVPGWSDYVAEKHDIARQAYMTWFYDGKPRCGHSYELMYKSRATFKQALRFCKRHQDQMQADALAYKHKNLDAKQFWKAVSASANHKATIHVNRIGNAVGEENICTMWYDYFKKLYNSLPNNGDSKVFDDACAKLTVNEAVCVSVNEVKTRYSLLKWQSQLVRMA